MARVKRGTKARARRKKILEQAKGYRGGQSKYFRTAIERVRRAYQFAFRDRRVRKRDFRSLWITRLNGAVRAYDLSYSQFIHGVKALNVGLNRKMLSALAISEPKAFGALVEQIKGKLTASLSS